MTLNESSSNTCLQVERTRRGARFRWELLTSATLEPQQG